MARSAPGCEMDTDGSTRAFAQCAICGGELVDKDVEKLLRGGTNTAVLTVHAEVCLRCGERQYAAETVQRFEQIPRKLEREDVGEFELVGQTHEVA
jgi:YgiT-type zinc finger domain-containing protein